jgi:hypothetical protein
MHPRTTTSGRAVSRHGRATTYRRPIAAGRRPGLLLAVAAAGAVAFNAVVGSGPAAQADAATGSVSVADQLGLTAQSEAVDATADLDPLEDLVASRSSREQAETAARQAQAKADRAELERQKDAARAKAKAEAAAKANAKAKAKAAAREAAAAEAEEQQADEAANTAAPSSTAVAAIAQISNSAGPVAPQVQAAANAVVSNVPGAGSITLGGTRPSAADPGGHPSGKALDYMVMSDAALGDAIAQYHIAHWDELGVEYIIWQQRMLSSPGGSWSGMEDRGSTTANHYDHVHVNYR